MDINKPLLTQFLGARIKAEVNGGMMHILVFFICVSIVVLFLGYMQAGALDRYSIAGISLICLLALVSVGVLGGTEFFAPTAFYIALLLLLHHAIIHRTTDFGEEKCACAVFQCKDVKNHETWVVASVTAGVVSFFNV